MHKDSRRISFGSYGLANLRSRGDALAFWDFLQRYMDVDHPLPDIPMLEASRHQDPTTQHFDHKVGRPARFWRDMDADQMQDQAIAMRRYVTRLESGEDLPVWRYDYQECQGDIAEKNKTKRWDKGDIAKKNKTKRRNRGGVR